MDLFNFEEPSTFRLLRRMKECPNNPSENLQFAVKDSLFDHTWIEATSLHKFSETKDLQPSL